MNKIKFLEHLANLDKLYYQDQKEQKAWDDFISVIAPNEYAPVVEGKLSTALDVLRIENKQIVEWLVYFFYEAKNMKDAKVISNGKEYNFGKARELIQFMEDNYLSNE